MGRTGARSLAPDLIEPARSGEERERAVALRALAELGWSEARELAMLALSERSELLQLAAVDALTELGDPRSASVLVGLFARGPESRFFSSALPRVCDS